MIKILFILPANISSLITRMIVRFSLSHLTRSDPSFKIKKSLRDSSR